MIDPDKLRFVRCLMQSMPRNGTEAYKRTHPDVTRESAAVGASRYMTDPDVKAEIEKWERELDKNAKMTAEEFHAHLKLIATADPRDLFEHWRGACRFCWGEANRYQRTPAEIERDLRAYQSLMEAKQTPDPAGIGFDMQGGPGFSRVRKPNPDCPECEGKGEEYEHFKDTRDLSPGAARLFAGIKRTKDGLEIKTRSQDKIIELVGNSLGVLKMKHEITGANGAPLTAVSVLTTDPTEAARIYQQMMSQGV